jgi:hypothetical protein
VSETDRLTWRRPLTRLHLRHVEKRMLPAQEAAVALGIPFDAAGLRTALAYERREPWRRIRGFVLILAILGVMAASLYPSACERPGGHPSLSAAECASPAAYLFGPGASLRSIAVLWALMWCVMIITGAQRGSYVASRYQPIYPLLDLLAISAVIATSDTPSHADAVKLNKKAAALPGPLHDVARHIASAYGDRKRVRAELWDHAARVAAEFTGAAEGLVADRSSAARRLGILSAAVAGNIAAERFTQLLSQAELREETPLEPDRLDGRRLARACLFSALAVAGCCSLLAALNAPVELLLPLALIAFLAIAYLSLASKYGLSEANRLTRAMGLFFSTSPPV